MSALVAPRPVGRNLTGPELSELAAAIAASPDGWRRLVRHDASARHYEELMRDDQVAVWLICWMPGHDTGFHDHDGSAGGVAVASGAVREERLALGGPPLSRVVGEGGSFEFGPTDIHRVVHAGEHPSITIHAYSPPLSGMGAYETTSTGELRRHSISYEQELRPLGSAAPRRR
jgi:predicted metal-dependent enzyme (double-stranded beta helix superfamily)